MKCVFFLLFILLMGIRSWARSSACNQGFDTLHTCDSYAALESDMNCGSQSYIQRFALPYCQAYLQQNDQFSPQGQIVLAKIRSCLQNELLNDADDGLTCQNIQDIGVASHYDCYIQSGFCSLNAVDTERVMWIAKAQVFNWPVLEVFTKVLEYCHR